MFISVVIPTYNRPKLLLKCLESLCQQRLSTFSFEIIVVTDGPDEVTALAVQDFSIGHTEVSIQCISPAVKKGPAAARNIGWKAAAGELILFTDDDTLPEPEWVAGYHQAYINAGRNEIAFTGKTVVPISSQPTDFEKNTAGLETAEFITANCACSKAALEIVGGFDEQFTMAWREDSDLHFRLIAANIPIQKVEDAIVVHPVRQVPWGVSIKEQKKGMFNALLYKNHQQLYEQKIGAKPLWNYYAMIALVLVAVVFLFAQLLVPAAVALVLWLILVLEFSFRRLRQTSKQPKHVLEMIYTSAIIPFLSVYWTIYGALRFKKLLF